MAKKVLGRDLADLLTRARPARLVGKASQATPTSAAAAVATDSRGAVPPVPLDLALSPTAAKSELKADPPTPTPPHDPARKAIGAAVPARAPASPGFSARQGFPQAPPSPPGPPRLFFILVALDVAFLAGAAVLFFTSYVPPKYARPAALLAVLAGGACTALAYLLWASMAPAPSTSKVRVQIRRI